MSQALDGATAALAPRRPFLAGGALGLVLVAPALAIIGLFFALPLGLSVVGAFQDKAGAWTLANLAKAFELYTTDFVFTVAIVALSSLLIALIAIAIAGY
ncbi:MAG TPA: sugar ABC transporter permease, partial [Casimicrobiaceae bacterium]|nr:sugar ABC transporter permease [Casimicrobiaceae bacterium]